MNFVIECSYESWRSAALFSNLRIDNGGFKLVALRGPRKGYRALIKTKYLRVMRGYTSARIARYVKFRQR